MSLTAEGGITVMAGGSSPGVPCNSIEVVCHPDEPFAAKIVKLSVFVQYCDSAGILPTVVQCFERAPRNLGSAVNVVYADNGAFLYGVIHCPFLEKYKVKASLSLMVSFTSILAYGCLGHNP